MVSLKCYKHPENYYFDFYCMYLVWGSYPVAGLCSYFQPSKSLKESLTPIIHCLCETCRANRNIRKFCRLKVSNIFNPILHRLILDHDIIFYF